MTILQIKERSGHSPYAESTHVCGIAEGVQQGASLKRGSQLGKTNVMSQAPSAATAPMPRRGSGSSSGR